MGTLTTWANVRLDSTGVKIRSALRLVIAGLPYDYCITSGLDGDHGDTPTSSYHYGVLDYGGYEAAANDVGCFNSRPDRSARGKALGLALYKHSDLFIELIISGVGSGINWAGGYYVKNGRRVAPYAVAAHYNHLHAAMNDRQADLLIARLTSSSSRVFTDLDLAWQS